MNYHANYIQPRLLHLHMVVQYMLMLAVHLITTLNLMCTLMIQKLTIGMYSLNQVITVAFSTC